MGFFERFKKNKVEEKDNMIYAPVQGDVVPLKDVKDQVFSEGILGPGCAIEPSDGTIFAPFSGKVENCIDTGHAIGVKSSSGIEVLIHVGLDTVELKGKYFEVHVKEGQSIKMGEKLISFDLEKIKAEGYITTTIVVVVNSDEYSEVTPVRNNGTVSEGEEFIEIRNK